MTHQTGFSPFSFTLLDHAQALLCEEFCSLPHYHLANTNLFLKVQLTWYLLSKVFFSILRSPSLSPTPLPTLLCPRWNQLYFYLSPGACKHTSVLMFTILHPGYPRVGLPGTAVASKAENMSYSSFTFPGPKRTSVSFSTQCLFAEFYWNSKPWYYRGTWSIKTKSTHSPVYVSYYAESLLFKGYFTMDHTYSIYIVWKRSKSVLSINVPNESFHSYLKSRKSVLFFYKSCHPQTSSLTLFLLIEESSKE